MLQKTTNSESERSVRITVAGVGGGGTNAVERMLEEQDIPLVRYIEINTDDGAVKYCSAETVIQIGRKVAQGWGAGANPQIGQLAAEENRKQIEDAIRNCDMLFIVSGMGGGTGTGAAPVVAEIARELNILTVAVVTTPFGFEGKKRMVQAEAGISNLQKSVDSMIIIPNDNLKIVSNKAVTLANAFAIADDVLVQTVKNLVEVIQRPAEINCDFADITSILQNSDRIHTAVGCASGPDKTEKVMEQIATSQLLGTSVDQSDGVLLYITASGDIGLDEIENLSSAISNRCRPDTKIIFGLAYDDDMADELKVVLIATHKTE